MQLHGLAIDHTNQFKSCCINLCYRWRRLFYHEKHLIPSGKRRKKIYLKFLLSHKLNTIVLLMLNVSSHIETHLPTKIVYYMSTYVSVQPSVPNKKQHTTTR